MVTDMENTLSPEQFAHGMARMQFGNRLTALRAIASPFVGASLALTESEYVATGFILGGIYTDYKDGSEARAGAEILGIETTIEGAIADPAADKIMANSLMLGHVIRSLRRMDPVGAVIVAGNYVVTKRRDEQMQHDRDLALEHGVDPKAIPINKLKFALQMIGNTVLSSPFSRNRRVRLIGLSALSGGTAVGLVGERIFRHRVLNAIEQNNQNRAEACPYAVPGTG